MRVRVRARTRAILGLGYIEIYGLYRVRFIGLGVELGVGLGVGLGV